MRVVLAVVAAAFAAAAVTQPSSAARPPRPAPVPSLTPVATQTLWTKLVHRRRAPAATVGSTAGCRAVRAIFYTESDWLRLATKLAATPSPCAQYYISIPPPRPTRRSSVRPAVADPRARPAVPRARRDLVQRLEQTG